MLILVELILHMYKLRPEILAQSTSANPGHHCLCIDVGIRQSKASSSAALSIQEQYPTNDMIVAFCTVCCVSQLM